MTPPPTVAVAGARNQLGRRRLISSYALVAFDDAISARVIWSGELRAVAEPLPEEAQAERAIINE